MPVTKERPDSALREDLKRVFQVELDRLASAASSQNPIEGVMRLRALGEIAAALDTHELLDLAVRVEAERGAKLPSKCGLV